MNINYDLAKELKDAGFPMPNRWGNVLENCTCGSSEYIGANKVHAPSADCLLVEPSLDELIEACGEETMFSLHRVRRVENTGGTPATTYSWGVEMFGADESKDEYFSGSTPTEAVARLWLALNPKANV